MQYGLTNIYITFSDIYKIDMENKIVIPSKSIFYWRFAEDICSRRKIQDNVFFNWLNYNLNIKLTIELNLPTPMVSKNFKFNSYKKSINLLSLWTWKLKNTKRNYNQQSSSSFKKNFIKLWLRKVSDKREVYEGWLPIIIQ